jgi:hypothetical protein
MTEQERGLTEKGGPGLGGFAEAGTIEPDVADKAEREPDVPRAPADPTDEPAPPGSQNPAARVGFGSGPLGTSYLMVNAVVRPVIAMIL